MGHAVEHPLSGYPAGVEAGDGRVLSEREGYQQETATLRQEKVYGETTSEVSEECNTADRNQGVAVKSSRSTIDRMCVGHQNGAHLCLNLQHT